MKTNGFTLIELLAVIVILAIIALIATPMVLNTIEEAKKGSAKSSGYAYISGLETGLASYMIKNSGASYNAGKYSVSTLSTDLEISLKGETPSEGNICIENNGLVSKASLKINGYVVSYDGKETTITDSEQIEDITCSVTSEEGTGPTKILAINGETYKAIVYLDPTDLTKKCDASNYVSTSETKSGCMKWYVYKDDGTNYTMILDHNTTAAVAWGIAENNTSRMIEVSEALSEDIALWDDTIKSTARLISADEVANITGADESLGWQSSKNYVNEPDLTTTISWFYLDGSLGSNNLWHTKVASNAVKSNYAWLYNYTNGCMNYGCEVEESNNYGYWTSTPVVNIVDRALHINRKGYLHPDYISNSSDNGVRPVITVLKDIIK